MDEPAQQALPIRSDDLWSTDGVAARRWLERLELTWARKISYRFAKAHGVVVIGPNENDAVVVASATPLSLEVLVELQRQLESVVEVLPVSVEVLERCLGIAFGGADGAATQVVDDVGDQFDLAMLAQELPEVTDLLEAANDAPIVKLINAVLTQAIRDQASDIHFEAFEKRSVIRFRVDGILRDVAEPKRPLHGALVSRLKIMAQMDISEKRLPQDGRLSLRIGERPVDVRVSTMPTQHGERVVLRLLDKYSAKLDLNELGMDKETYQGFDQLLRRAHGIILVTGPTGSGKTTTLYAGVSRLDRKRINIVTIEDPVEYDLDGIGQTQVNSKIGLTFAHGLRTILRQDPDVVLVGEIRDRETAQIAVQASLTGHLVLSTLHTNTAVGAITRLIDMGIEPFLISSSLLGVLSQRLVRTFCNYCSPVTPVMQDGTPGIASPSPRKVGAVELRGCSHCDGTGYRGRTGIYELILVDGELRNMVHAQESEEAILRHARRHTPSIRDNGMQKVDTGMTSIEEVLRVTRDE